MSIPALEVDGLRVSYRRRDRWQPVLAGVSLRVEPGEAYGLVGESGCGKTTVALAAVGHLAANARVDAGRIRIGGADIVQASRRDLRRLRGSQVAMVYQDPAAALNPSLRVGVQVAEAVRAHTAISRTDTRSRTVQLLGRVGLPDPEHLTARYPHELSGGQQQRVIIAIALAGDPRLLVLDEPTTALDTTVQAEVMDLLGSLRRDLDVAMLLITHNLALLPRLCDRVGVLYAGRIVEQAPTRRLLDRPRHPYTYALRGCVPRLATAGEDPAAAIPGAPPAPGTLLPGCTFAPRCPFAQDRCHTAEPGLVPVGDQHLSRCWFPETVPSSPAQDATQVRSRRPGGPRAHSEPGRPEQPVLELRGLTKTFGRGAGAVRAVDRVDLDIKAGETFGLIGESGSGKSTLARCVAGLTQPEQGRLRLLGAPQRWRATRRSRTALAAVQMVFQHPDSTLNPVKRVRMILARSVRLLAGLTGRANADRVRAVAGAVLLSSSHLDLVAARLSGGLKQRAAIARAFAGTPRLVICDEPVSSLDVSTQAAVLALLRRLRDDAGVSYLFISHDLAVVGSLADRIGVLYDGRLLEEGPAGAVLAGPRHPYTDALLVAMPTLDHTDTDTEADAGGREPTRLRADAATRHVSTGCRFHPRCPRKLGGICEQVEPEWHDAGGGHRIRCHIPPDQLA